MKGAKKELGNKKRLYLLAVCGVLAVSGAIYAGTRGSGNKPEEPKQDLVDLNEEPGGISQGEGNNESDSELQAGLPDTVNPNESGNEVAQGDIGQNGQKPADIDHVVTLGENSQPDPEITLPNTPNTGLVGKQDTPDNTIAEQKPEKTEPDTPVKNVAENPKNDQEIVTEVNNPTADELKFSEEEGLVWPLKGDVVKSYNVDKMVYFETLQQFRTNPAIFIAGNPGADIVAATDGIVVSVGKEDKLGQTLTVDIGDGYRLLYGQLGDLKVKEGDYIKAGTVLAKLATVTKYYRMEGNHLYFQVQKDEETINPLTLIK